MKIFNQRSPTYWRKKGPIGCYSFVSSKGLVLPKIGFSDNFAGNHNRKCGFPTSGQHDDSRAAPY